MKAKQTDVRRITDAIIALWPQPNQPAPTVEQVLQWFKEKKFTPHMELVRGIVPKIPALLNAYREKGKFGITGLLRNQREDIILQMHYAIERIHSTHHPQKKPKEAPPAPTMKGMSLLQRAESVLLKAKFRADLGPEEARIYAALKAAVLRGKTNRYSDLVNTTPHLAEDTRKAVETETKWKLGTRKRKKIKWALESIRAPRLERRARSPFLSPLRRPRRR